MRVLITFRGNRILVKPVAEEPGMDVDAPELEIIDGGEAYGLTYFEAFRHGEGEMKIPEPEDGISYWLPRYMDRFGDSINFDAFWTEEAAVGAIREALEAGVPIPEPDPGMVI